MQILLSLLAFSKKYAQSVIVVLLGIIASGSIAGGFWIAQLRESVATREKQLEADKRLSEVRDDLHKQQLANATAVADIENRRIREKLSESARLNKSLLLYVDRIDAVVGQHLNSDRDLVSQLTPGSAAQDRTAIPPNAVLAGHLRASVDDTTAQIAVAKNWTHWVLDSSNDVAAPTNYDSPSMITLSPPTSHAPLSTSLRLFLSFSLLAIGIGLVFGLSLLARTLLKRRRQLQTQPQSDGDHSGPL